MKRKAITLNTFLGHKLFKLFSYTSFHPYSAPFGSFGSVFPCLHLPQLKYLIPKLPLALAFKAGFLILTNGQYVQKWNHWCPSSRDVFSLLPLQQPNFLIGCWLSLSSLEISEQPQLHLYLPKETLAELHGFHSLGIVDESLRFVFTCCFLLALGFFPPSDYPMHLHVSLPRPAQVTQISVAAVNSSKVNSQYFHSVQHGRSLDKMGKLWNCTYLYFIYTLLF